MQLPLTAPEPHPARMPLCSHRPLAESPHAPLAWVVIPVCHHIHWRGGDGVTVVSVHCVTAESPLLPVLDSIRIRPIAGTNAPDLASTRWPGDGHRGVGERCGVGVDQWLAVTARAPSRQSRGPPVRQLHDHM